MSNVVIVGALSEADEMLRVLTDCGCHLVFATSPSTVAVAENVFVGSLDELTHWAHVFPQARFLLTSSEEIPKGIRGQTVSVTELERIRSMFYDPFEAVVDQALSDVFSAHLSKLIPEPGLVEASARKTLPDEGLNESTAQGAPDREGQASVPDAPVEREETQVIAPPRRSSTDVQQASSSPGTPLPQEAPGESLRTPPLGTVPDDEDDELKTPPGGTPAVKTEEDRESLGERVRKRMRRLSNQLFPGREVSHAVENVSHDSRVDLNAITEDSIVEEEIAVGDVGSFRATGTLAEAGYIRVGVSDAAVLLAKAARDRLTGRMRFTQGDVEKSLFFQDGWVAFAETSVHDDRLGRMLIREGKVTGAVVENALEQGAEKNVRLGESLVDIGGLKAKELSPSVERHLTDIVCSLFAWNHGQYEVTAGDFSHGESIRLNVPPAALIAEGLRRKFPAHDMLSILGGAETTLQIVDRGNYRLAYTFVVENTEASKEEQEAIRLLLAAKSLGEVAHDLNVPLNIVAMLAYGLFVLGVAAPHDWNDTPLPSLVMDPDHEELEIDRRRVQDKVQQVRCADYFEILGVEPSATSYEVGIVYRKRLKEYSLDEFAESLRGEIAEDLQEIQEALREAFSVLNHPLIRPGYQQYR